MRSQTGIGAGHTELSGGYNPYAQRLAALEQISLAASRVLDPTELTRIALDEAIRILAGTRLPVPDRRRTVDSGRRIGSAASGPRHRWRRHRRPELGTARP